MRLRHTHTRQTMASHSHNRRFHTPSHTVTNRSHFMSTCNEHESHSRPHQTPPHAHQRQPLSILSAQRPARHTPFTPHIQVIHCHSRTLLPVAYAYTALKTTGLKTNPQKLWAAPLSGREEEDERRILCKVGSPKRCTLAVGKKDDVEER